MTDVFHAPNNGGNISLSFAKHVDLEALEPNRLKHEIDLAGIDCPACFRSYIPRHRKEPAFKLLSGTEEVLRELGFYSD